MQMVYKDAIVSDIKENEHKQFQIIVTHQALNNCCQRIRVLKNSLIQLQLRGVDHRRVERDGVGGVALEDVVFVVGNIGVERGTSSAVVDCDAHRRAA